MWDSLKKQLEVERRQLNRLLEAHRPLLAKCERKKPSVVELSALAAMLHTFYTGIENIFRRVAVEMDGKRAKGESWQRQLLETMARATPDRGAVISSTLWWRLRGYLDFRHAFRHGYTLELQWAKMASLARGCEKVWRELEAELQGFITSLKKSDQKPGRGRTG